MTVKMSKSKIDRLLEEANAGVLSLTDGAETYAVPESFGYDGEYLYFQFVYDEESQKMAFINTTEIATITIFSENPAQSVVVRGRLEQVPKADQSRAAAAIAENAEIPTLNVLPETTPEELSMTFYRLKPTEFSGRIFESCNSASLDS
ncbi:pyridoxamine 5'-phosphate oxidase family protein [Halorussus amylolyticus]|uniref:pyridoxamine 5'-phosphate oxidase family protein n=1 Tax=Halorussus amylolyticus TaxID=1126242 RepID=UPI00104C9F95|nr:pyridoxamine 5'-phosphate oxidase family protein [Halorussus amylolyticus]